MLGRNKKSIMLIAFLAITGGLTGSQLVDSLLSTNSGWITLPLNGILSYGIVLILIIAVAPFVVPLKSLRSSMLNLRGAALITLSGVSVGILLSLIDLMLFNWLGDASPVRGFLLSLATFLCVLGIPVLVFKEWPWRSEKDSRDSR